MSNLICPVCGSTKIQTEKRLDGFHHCMDCRHVWRIGASQKKPTNGDKIIAGGMRAIAEFQQSCSCDICTYFDDGNPFRAGCGRPHDKTCTDGIIAWLDSPAEIGVRNE